MAIVSSAVNVLKALEVVCASRGAVSLQDLTCALQVSEPTAYRVVQTLVQSGYVSAVDGRHGYRATLKVLEIAATVVDQYELKDVARPVLQRLAEHFKESVTVAVPDQDHIVFIDRITVSPSVQFYCDVGRRLPLHRGAAARCILAYLPEEVFYAYASRQDRDTDSAESVTAEGLSLDRRRVRADGHAVSVDGVDVGISGVGVPILNGRREVLGAAVIANLTARWSDADHRDRAKALLAAVAEIQAMCAHVPATRIPSSAQVRAGTLE